MVTDKSCSSAAAMTLLSILAANLPSQGSWSQTPTTGSPPLLGAHAAAYDLLHHRMVLFGGFNPSYAMEGETWQFDGVTWTRMASMPAPTPRAGHAMAYDSQRNRIVLFGGAATMLAPASQDTWEHDGSTWTQPTTNVAPSARLDHAMCYDVVRGRVVLFGGRVGSAAVIGDTWEWDGLTWVNSAITGPSPRKSHAMCFDMIRGVAVLFGGSNAQGPMGDTWEWDGTSWQQMQSAATPSARAGHAMAYDIAGSVSVLHGGIPGGDETWEWDGTLWTQHGFTSYAVNNHVLVYDAQLQRSTLYGGTVTANPVYFASEVDTYGHRSPGTYVAHGTSCPGSTATPVLSAPPSVAMGPMIGETSLLQVTPSWVHTFFTFGWSDTFENAMPLPHSLAAYGMPGCALQVSRDAITSAAAQNGTAKLFLTVANDPFLVGVRFYVQAMSLDLGANAGGFTTTNRLAAVVGRN